MGRKIHYCTEATKEYGQENLPVFHEASIRLCVCRTPDVELILSDSAFDEEKMAQKRQLMCPGW